jgi:putative spermidine/putrescine transport system permease protein
VTIRRGTSVAPAVASAALFAFLGSFDDLLIPLFLAKIGSETLTVRIWNSLRLEIDPTIAAVSALLIGVAVVVVGTSSLLQRRDGDGA